jgi:4-carboxymuconolactone decarboxylase
MPVLARHPSRSADQGVHAVKPSKLRRNDMSELTTKTPVLDLLASMTADSIEASSLDAETLMLVRIAALAAVDAPPISYALNLQAASDLDIDPDQVRGVLAAIAPIVGTARIASATVNILEALEIAIEVEEVDEGRKN